MSDDREARELWRRPEFSRVAGRVTRIGTTYVSLELTRPYGLVTVAWSGPLPRVGARVSAAVQDRVWSVNKNFRVIVVKVPRRLRMPQLVLANRPITAHAALPPDKPQPWLDVLVRHGLLAREKVIGRDHYTCDPISLLRSIYRPTEARDQGFVYYDHRWGNDTDDVVEDLAVLANCPECFALISVTRDVVEFEVRPPVAAAVRLTVEMGGDALLDLSARMNDWLAKLDTDRRIWAWETGIDALAFLGRSQDEVAQMKEEGLPLDGLYIAGSEVTRGDAAADPVDWSDV